MPPIIPNFCCNIVGSNTSFRFFLYCNKPDSSVLLLWRYTVSPWRALLVSSIKTNWSGYESSVLSTVQISQKITLMGVNQWDCLSTAANSYIPFRPTHHPCTARVISGRSWWEINSCTTMQGTYHDSTYRVGEQLVISKMYQRFLVHVQNTDINLFKSTNTFCFIIVRNNVICGIEKIRYAI